ncbi:uncharacterized protein G2W53_011746 [Senna tora]|uniref:Uncharacterized protein n=1 Tax=Senna tora TaxID=362788 RepID=A0A834X213_9FABA|nr:uncharacterized protein G2W53_011746 [Senna tora]
MEDVFIQKEKEDEEKREVEVILDGVIVGSTTLGWRDQRGSIAAKSTRRRSCYLALLGKNAAPSECAAASRVG